MSQLEEVSLLLPEGMLILGVAYVINYLSVSFGYCWGMFDLGCYSNIRDFVDYCIL